MRAHLSPECRGGRQSPPPDETRSTRAHLSPERRGERTTPVAVEPELTPVGETGGRAGLRRAGEGRRPCRGGGLDGRGGRGEWPYGG
jgi:hypothetical protein